MVVVGLRRAAGECSGFEARREKPRARRPRRAGGRAWGAVRCPGMRAASARRPRRAGRSGEAALAAVCVYAAASAVYIGAPGERVGALRLPTVWRGSWLRGAEPGQKPLEEAEPLISLLIVP